MLYLFIGSHHYKNPRRNWLLPISYGGESIYFSILSFTPRQTETIRKICGTQSEKSGTLNKTWVSTNALLDKSGQFYYQYCVGMKTGSTGLAGKCLVSVAKNGDTECISVVLNDSTDEQRWTDAKKLFRCCMLQLQS